MFFFASDNILSPSMLTQIKAIKAAGYQQDTNVLLHFDPNEKGAPTRVFEVNRAESQAGGPSRIGDSNHLVSVLTSDDITSTTFRGAKADIDAMESKVALEKFLDTCREDYPADHYMLFLVGHGMVVGRDSFLPDENPVSAIGLVDLGKILNTFKDNTAGKLELIGMHSCSMSGVEISYQLQDTASFMLGSQGVSFLGAWPYRQMLITIYNAIEAERKNPAQPVSVVDLLEHLHDLSIQHSADFMVGGYSADLCLSTLNSKNVANLDKPIQDLAQSLTKGLKHPRCLELILLAHWKSQSYWQETYTDLYDFCLCLRELCLQQNGNRPAQAPPGRPQRVYDETQRQIEEACATIMQILKPKRPTAADGPVVRADFIGPATQYSHGLSIYFPWSEPVQDKNEKALENYAAYEFSSRPLTKGWLIFLRSYFQETQRSGRVEEDRDIKGQDASYQTPDFMHALDDAQQAFKVPGTAAGQPQSVPTALDGGKVIPPDSGGGGACACLSIKNYSPEFVMSSNASKVFGSAGGPSAKAAGAAVKQQP
ncbi:MAG TPA: clostripain-related cysteine peptidase [Pyrinomonadaceae bacterium]